MATDIAQIYLWDQFVGAVAREEGQQYAAFEFDKDFLKRGLDIAPITMPITTARRGNAVFQFPGIADETFKGLPGLLADSLPDDFGNSLIDVWLTRKGLSPEDYSVIRRLLYIGRRGMGALEYRPAEKGGFEQSVSVEVTELVAFAQKVLDDRGQLRSRLDEKDTDALLDIIRVGTSAGGARPKVIIAWNEESNEVRSGQVEAPEGFGYWLLKFDGVTDSSLGDPKGYGRIEQAYYKMAIDCKIDMSECRLFKENGRAHFMTKRFDRRADGQKIHMQSLCAIAHFNFKQAGAYGYESVFSTMRKLKLPYKQMVEQFRRMVFNVVARNQDDHPKNTAFLMDAEGEWRLSPAYDVTYSHNPDGKWTDQHQMSINGKRDHFETDDLLAVAKQANIKDADKIVKKIVEVVSCWNDYAEKEEVDPIQIGKIKKSHRLKF
jgi:serine/threonine-protein kinase HipA